MCSQSVAIKLLLKITFQIKLAKQQWHQQQQSMYNTKVLLEKLDTSENFSNVQIFEWSYFISLFRNLVFNITLEYNRCTYCTPYMLRTFIAPQESFFFLPLSLCVCVLVRWWKEDKENCIAYKKQSNKNENGSRGQHFARFNQPKSGVNTVTRWGEKMQQNKFGTTHMLA